MWEDSSLDFTGEFYKNLRILSQDLYRKSASIGHSTADNLGSNQVIDASKPGKHDKRINSIIKRQSSFNATNTIITSPKELNSTEISNELDVSSQVEASQNISERLRVYMREGGFPTEFIDRYSDILKIKNKDKDVIDNI